MVDAIEQALVMPVAEQRERMRLMREIVRLPTVHRWAGQMLLDAADLRKRRRVLFQIMSRRQVPNETRRSRVG